MFRAILVLFLIAGLSTCPLRCAATVCGAERSDEGAVPSSVCSCCTENSPAPADSCDAPEQCPGGDCTCGSCICNGAVSEHEDVSLLNAPQDALADLSSVVSAGAPPFVLLGHGSAADHSRGGYFADGREARIAHQSLQI